MNREPHELTWKEARGMTVNERLWVSGYMPLFYEAAEKKDIEKLTSILEKLQLGQENIEAIIRSTVK